MTVWLLTTGSGADGDWWNVLSIHASLESAERAKKSYESPQTQFDGTVYSHKSNIEEWNVEL